MGINLQPWEREQETSWWDAKNRPRFW